MQSHVRPSIGRLTGESEFLWVGDIVPEVRVELVCVESAVNDGQVVSNFGETL